MALAQDIAKLNLRELSILCADLKCELGEDGVAYLIKRLSASTPDAHKLWVNTYKMVGKINVIKAVRVATDMGLKEAKDLTELYGGFEIYVSSDKLFDFRNSVQAEGCIVTEL